MSIRNILWTALPNGFSDAAGKLRLSVLVSPRLVTDNGTDGTLQQFPDFLDWPAVVEKLRFRVEFQNGPAFSAAPVVEPGFPSLDSASWTSLFSKQTFVRSYQFDRDGRTTRWVRSYPTKKVLTFLREQYRRIALSSPATKPDLRTLGFDRNSEDRGFWQLFINDESAQGLERRLNVVLEGQHAVPANLGLPPIFDFYQVRVMHEFLSKKVPKPDGTLDGTLEPLPPQTLPEVDFHKAIAALGQYPNLMRALGIVIDLEVPTDKVAATGNVRVAPSLEGAPPMMPWTAYKLDQTIKLFLAAPDGDSDVTDGMLLFSGDQQYDVVEVDLDGAANKALNFAFNVGRIALGETPKTLDTPDNYGLPSLRSAGFSAARVDRALRLVQRTFNPARDNNNAITANPQNSNVILHADDVTRGYRIDVWSSLSGQWHSVCLRQGHYKFLNTGITRDFDDEGFTTVATSESADGSTDLNPSGQPNLRLPESLFRWTGWSLCAPRAGKTVGSDSTAQTPTNPATTDIKLETSFTVQPGTLSRLRFGAQYQFRARAVDLAGNSFSDKAVLAAIYNLPPQPIAYLRYEPVAAPIVVLRAALGADTTPGESVETIVIRSNFDTHIAATSERHIAPPKTSQTMAETHGMLDTPAGPPDKALYNLLVNRDGSFNSDPAKPDKPVPHPEPQLTLPYLPDPFAPGAAFRTLPGTLDGSVWTTPFTGTWPDMRPFRLVLDEGSGVPEFSENETERVLRVHLPKAEVVKVALSCFLTDDDTTQPPRMLSTMKIWSWIVEANPANLSDLQQLALDGGHWMLTPPRTLTLVHAVQQPLIEPQFQRLRVARNFGETFATLFDEMPINGKSTIKLDIEANWQEHVDDLSDKDQPQVLNGAAHAFQVPLSAEDTVATIGTRKLIFPPETIGHVSKHEFHDTKHRTVTYTAVATTRFREYFPNAITSDPANITRRSQPVTISIPSSSRPPAPKPLYVIPTFGWEQQTEDAWNFKRRSGGGLRVYVDRPWFSSGDGELLGAVLWECAPPKHDVFGDVDNVPDSLKGYVTQWGKDPIWSAPSLPSQAAPRREHFRNAVAFGTGLSLDEVGDPSVPFAVAGHKVHYAKSRQLWYCDIEMDMGDAYFPFVRLALARYQPDSLPNAHLSRLVLADFAQLLPDRSVSITFDPLDPTTLQLAVAGITAVSRRTLFDPGTPATTMTVTLQTQAPGGGNVAWVPVSVTTLQPALGVDPVFLWTAQIVLPTARGSRAYRLLIEEFEMFFTDVNQTQQQRRLVYADLLSI
jgi:hypothetical protein